MFTYKRAELESEVAEVGHLEEPISAPEEDMEALRVVRMRVDELTAERASLTAGTEKAKE